MPWEQPKKWQKDKKNPKKQKKNSSINYPKLNSEKRLKTMSRELADCGTTLIKYMYLESLKGEGRKTI